MRKAHYHDDNNEVAEISTLKQGVCKLSFLKKPACSARPKLGRPSIPISKKPQCCWWQAPPSQS
jgi:hypothetical protein